MRKTPDGNGNNHNGKRGKLFKRSATVTATARTAKFNNTRGSKGDSGSSVDAPGKPVIGTKRTEVTDNRKPGRPGRRPINAGAGSGAGAGAGTRGNSGNSGSSDRATGTGTAKRGKADVPTQAVRVDDVEEPEVENLQSDEIEVEAAPKVVKRGRKPATSKAGLKKDIEEKAEHLLGKMWGGLFGATGTLYGAHWGLQPAESSKLAADTMDVFRFLPEETFNRIIEFFTKVVPAGALVVSVMSLTIPRIAMTKMLINAQAQTSNT